MSASKAKPSAILHIIGLTLIFCGVGLVMASGVELLIGATDDWRLLLGIGAFSLAIGVGLQRYTVVPDRIPLVDVFASVAMSWVTMALVGTLPFYLTGTVDAWDEALFESVSGFTTTGATVLQASEVDPTRFAASDGMLFWRSMTQWLGGMGVIVLVIAILPSVGAWGMGLMSAEAPGPQGERLTPRVRSTARRLWAVYVAFTIAMCVAYLIAGLSLYDSVVHSFTTVSTGGFSPYTLSIAHFDSALIEWIVIVGMFIAGTSFTLIYKLVRGSPGPLLRSVEFRIYVLVILVATILVFLFGSESQGPSDFRNSLFTITSVVTTTGFGTVDFVGEWSDAGQAIILVLIPLGAMAGSTSGGVKIIRGVIAASFTHRTTLGQLHQRMVRPVRVGGAIVDETVVKQVLGFVALSTATLATVSVLLALTGQDLITAFSAAATTFGNVGPGLGEVGPRGDFLGISAFGKLVTVGAMLFGRLEIYPILLALVKLPVPRLRPLFARLFRQPY